MTTIDPIIISLDDRLANAGDTLSVSGSIDIAEFSFGERELSLPNGLAYDVVLTNAGEGILATGMLRAQAIATCDRCLDEATLSIAGEVDEYYLFHEPDPGVLEDDEEEGPDYSLIGANSKIDLTDALTSALVMDVPYVILCREDCKGLCPVCGENLNHVDCGHAGQMAKIKERDRLDSSPFAVLKNLNLPDE